MNSFESLFVATGFVSLCSVQGCEEVKVKVTMTLNSLTNAASLLTLGEILQDIHLDSPDVSKVDITLTLQNKVLSKEQKNDVVLVWKIWS